MELTLTLLVAVEFFFSKAFNEILQFVKENKEIVHINFFLRVSEANEVPISSHK